MNESITYTDEIEFSHTPTSLPICRDCNVRDEVLFPAKICTYGCEHVKVCLHEAACKRAIRIFTGADE